MAKRVFAWLGVILGAIVLFFAVCTLVLFLAPGVEIFGVRYVANGISSYRAENINIKDLTNKEEFSGNIYIKTHGVPVKIQYTSLYASHLSFCQDFIGLTRSKIRKANLMAYVDDDDNLHIETEEIVPWLYSHKTTDGSNFYFELALDLRLIDRDLHIDSENSKVTIIGNPKYNVFECNTESALEIDGKITADTFIYHTSKAIEIKDKVEANNFDLSSKNSPITITKPVKGYIKAETKAGNLSFVSCKELEATTISGDIRHYGEGLGSVGEGVKISTHGGVVDLGTVGIEAENPTKNMLSITTISGNVSLTRMVDGTITSTRGKITVGNCRNLIVNSKIGDVKVDTVTEGVLVSGGNGRVKLGENGAIVNPTVSTTTGTIEAYHTSGVVSLKSQVNSITLKNDSSEDITLDAGRTLTATGLLGEVNAKANGNVDFQFKNVTGNVNLSLGNRAKSVKIDATCVSYDFVNYSLRSTKGKKAQVYVGDTLLTEPNSVLESEMVQGLSTIRVSGAYAEIVLYLGSL